jgi:hypothetical protein
MQGEGHIPDGSSFRRFDADPNRISLCGVELDGSSPRLDLSRLEKLDPSSAMIPDRA